MPPLSDIFQYKLIPWSQQNVSKRFIVARSKMRQADMPYGVQLIPHKIQPPRLISKNRRCYGNVRNIIAEWPEAGLSELGKYMLMCTLEEYVDYTVGNHKIQCGPGHFIFIPPGTPIPDGSRTYVDLEKSTFCEIITFVLHPKALECWTSHCDARGRIRDNNILLQNTHVVSLFHTLMEECHNGQRKLSGIGEKLTSVFFDIILREIDAERFQKIKPNFRTERKATMVEEGFLPNLKRYIEANLHHHLTIDTVAAAMYFSPAQFTRVMRRETGESFNEYLAKQRLAEAKQLLLNTDLTITAIAKSVGLTSNDYFRTFFKRHVGLTPTEFRKYPKNHQI